jgi:hypothetical protein
MVFEDAIFVLFFRRKEPKELELGVTIENVARKPPAEDFRQAVCILIRYTQAHKSTLEYIKLI